MEPLLKNKDHIVTRKDVDELMFKFNGNKKTIIKVPYEKPIDIKVGNKYWHFNTDGLLAGFWELITITYIRSEVVFYTSDHDKNKKEDSFPIGCIMSRMLEPETYIADFYTEFVSDSEKVVIKYEYDGSKRLNP